MQAEHHIRVRYGETDRMGIAHHGAYIDWLEEARIEALRGLGHSYRALEDDGLAMPVVELQVRYRSPVAFDDRIRLCTTAAVTGPSRLHFVTEIDHQGRAVATGTVTVACLDAQGRPRRLPGDLLDLLAG